MDLVCTNCRTPHQSGTKYCTQCGKDSLVAHSSVVCPKCRNVNTPTSKFCGNCSHLLAETELRPLSILFCDIVGSTELNQELGDETYNNEILLSYREICKNAVHQNSGRITEYLGDGIVAYFGYPEVHEDDARNAVSAGWQIVQSVTHDKTLPRPFQVRVGVHTALAFMSQGKAEGVTPALASRVQDVAQPNTVLITEATQQHVVGYFHLEEQKARRLKGFARASRLYAVVGVTGARSRLEARAIKGLTPLVGRKQEVELLSKCWEKTKLGSGQTVLIGGEPGIGKSRVIEEFKKTLTQDSAILLEGYCSFYQKDTAFAPIADCLKQVIGITAEDSPQEKWSKLNNEFYSVASLTSTLSVPLIAQVLSMDMELVDPLPKSLTPIRQRQTLEALMSWLLEKSRKLPLLIIVEDLHWADPSTLELLSLIMSQQPTKAVMLLASFRPEFSHSWPSQESVHEIILGRLVPEQTTVVVNHVANNHPLPPFILQEVIDRTDGVPLFIEEMTKTILESGYLKLENDAYELTEALPPHIIPLTVQDSLMARLDRLGPEKILAQIGATLGPEFRYDVLKAVAQAILKIPDEDLQDELERLVEADLMTRSGELIRGTYGFKHALIQEVAYKPLLESTKRQYHEQIATVLETEFPDIKDSTPELIAQHFAAGGSDKQALGYWEKAGQRALERAANAEAINHFDRALEYLQTSPGTEEYAREELQCHLSRGPALMYVKGYAAPEVKQCYGRAFELCERMGETKQLFKALWGQWASRFVGGDLGPACELGLQIVKLAESMNDPAFLPPARHALGYPLCYQAEYAAAIEQADLGIAVFDLDVEKQNSIDYQFSSTTALYNFSATALWMLGYPEKALVRAKEALKLAQLIDRKPVLAFALTSSLWVYQLGRDAQSIFEGMKEFMTLSSDEQGYFWPSLAGVFHGWARIEMGDPDNGVREIRRSWAVYQDIGGGVLRTHGFALLAEGLWKLGRLEEALDTISSAIETIKTSREYHFQPELYRVKGEILKEVHGNNSDGTEIAFQKAVDLSRAQHTKWLELRAVMSLSALWCAQGRKDAARLELQQIYEWFTEGFETRDLVEARNFLNQLQ